MGYSTYFSGSFTINKKVDDETYALLEGLNRTRRMKRDPAKLAKRLKMKKKEVIEKYGDECQLYIPEGSSYESQKDTDDVVNGNEPPKGQPGLWCGWQIQEDRKTICHDGGEKFYDYIEWIEYLINVVLKPRGYVVNDEVTWQGEESDDMGAIEVINNTVRVKEAVVFYLTPEDAKRVEQYVTEYLTNPLKELIDHKIDQGKEKKKRKK